MSSNVFLQVLTGHILTRIKEEMSLIDDKILVIDDSATTVAVGCNLKFQVRLVCFAGQAGVAGDVGVGVSQEISEEFSLPGFEIELVCTSAIEPI